MTIEEIIKQIKIKAEGRTRYIGQEQFWDEVLVGEIERLRKLVDYYATALDITESQM
jgi:hypothetical protein